MQHGNALAFCFHYFFYHFLRCFLHDEECSYFYSCYTYVNIRSGIFGRRLGRIFLTDFERIQFLLLVELRKFHEKNERNKTRLHERIMKKKSRNLAKNPLKFVTPSMYGCVALQVHFLHYIHVNTALFLND